MSKSARNRQERLRDFTELCESVGFHLEPFQKKVAGALLGPQREKLITLTSSGWLNQESPAQMTRGSPEL